MAWKPGTIGSGKGTAAHFLKNFKNYRHIQIRDLLSRVVLEKGLQVNRDTMLEVANELRAERGPAVLVELALKDVKKGEKILIDSIRCRAEVQALKEAGGFVLATYASQLTRFSRIQSRGGCTDHVSFEEFRQNDAREMQSDSDARPSLKDLIQLADARICNDDDLDTFHRSLSELFDCSSSLPWLCIVGPHGSGKTHLLRKVCEELQEHGLQLQICEELARNLIKELGLTLLGACIFLITLSKTNIFAPENRPKPKRKG